MTRYAILKELSEPGWQSLLASDLGISKGAAIKYIDQCNTFWEQDRVRHSFSEKSKAKNRQKA